MTYQSPRDYMAANFATRTMRWTGIIVLALPHLPPRRPHVGLQPIATDFVRGDAYHNVVASLEPAGRWRVIYIVANLALGVHLFHGAWRMFQSLGLNNPRFNTARARASPSASPSLIVGINVMLPDHGPGRRRRRDD